MPFIRKDKKIEDILGKLDAVDRRDIFRRIRDAVFLQNIFDNIREGIVIFDRFLEIRFANFAARDIFGIPDSFEGQKISSYLKNFDWKGFLARKDELSFNISRNEIEIDYPQSRLLLFYILPHREDKDSFVAIFHDVTEISEKTREMHEQQKDNMISLLAAGVAHEIGNPLNSISIHLQLLEKNLSKKPKINSENLELLSTAKEEISRLELIIRRFLRALRIDTPVFGKADIKRILIETLSSIKPEIELKKIKVNCEISDSIPPLRIDESQIKQAFFNIIKNAIESMSEGGELEIKCKNDEDYAKIYFTDNGCGIAPEMIDKIFNPYFTTKKTGSGLGLMVVDKIIKANKGRLSVDSRSQKGTTFTIELPFFDKKPKLLVSEQKKKELLGD